jgi:putative ABC transport system permease protein
MRPSLRSWVWRVPIEDEFDEEVAFHLEMRTRELIARGMPPDAARAEARRRLGNISDIRRTCLDLGTKRDREMRITQWIDELRDDVRFALRLLKASRPFTLVAVATLALGIGANSAIFAIVDATLLRPLPYPAPNRLLIVSERADNGESVRVSPPNLLDWHDRSRSFDSIGGFFPGVGAMVMANPDGTGESISRQWVSSRFFEALGVQPIAGRTFNQDDERQRARVAVMNEVFWRTRFAADPSIVGRELRLDGEQYKIVGIVPSTVQLVGPTNIWALVPIDRRPQLRGIHVFQAIGRLKAGVTAQQASADLASVADGLATEFPANKNRGITLTPLRDYLVGGDLRFTSALFLGVVGFVLLLCCANVANLLLARATVRARELAIRSAIGAGAHRIGRQLLTESLVLSAIGGAVGVAVGASILGVAPTLVPQGLLPPAVTITFDARVTLFCAAAAIVVGVVFGLAPAWQATHVSSTRLMTMDGRTATGRGETVRQLLVTGEVAIAVLLLFGAGLLLRTLFAVENVDRGYRATSVLTMLVDPLGGRYPTPVSLLQFFDQVEHEVAAVPGVATVGWTSALPLDQADSDRTLFDIVGDPPLDAAHRPMAKFQIVSPRYFKAIDLPIVSGRNFNDLDRRDGVQVCIVSEAFVRRYLAGRPAAGVQVLLRNSANGQARGAAREIVGVARQVKDRPDEKEEVADVYLPMAQNAVDDIYMVVRPAAGRAEALTAAVRAAIGRVDTDNLVGVRRIMTLDDIARASTERHRFRAALIVTFAALALALAMVGVFGIMAYSVERRVRDLAVRRAVGATTRDVLALVLGSAAKVVGAGAVIGLVLSAALGRLLVTLLFGVQPLDPRTFAAVTIVVAVTAALSTAAPAWRATRIDPASALRQD